MSPSAYDLWQDEILSVVTFADPELDVVAHENQSRLWSFLLRQMPECSTSLWIFFILCLFASLILSHWVRTKASRLFAAGPTLEDLKSNNATLKVRAARLGQDLSETRQGAISLEHELRTQLHERHCELSQWKRAYHETYDTKERLCEEQKKFMNQSAHEATKTLNRFVRKANKDAEVERRMNTEKAQIIKETQEELKRVNRHFENLRTVNETLRQKNWDLVHAPTIAARTKQTLDSNDREQKIIELSSKLANCVKNRNAAISEKETLVEELASIKAERETESSQVESLEQDKKKIAAELESKVAELEKSSSLALNVQQEKEKIAKDLKAKVEELQKNSSLISSLQQEKEKIAKDLKAKVEELQKNSSLVSSLQQEKEKIAKDLKAKVEELQKNSSLVSNLQQEKEQIATDLKVKVAELGKSSSLVSNLQREKDTIAAELSSLKQNHQRLSAIHGKCSQAPQIEDKMDTEMSADGPSDEDDMDIDNPKQALLDQLELANKKIQELNEKNAKLLEAMRGQSNDADVLGERSSGAAKERIREEVERDFREERGSYLRRIAEQDELLKKQTDQLKSTNVSVNISMQLQAERKAALEKASRLEYELSTLRSNVPKATTSSTAPAEAAVIQESSENLRREIGSLKLQAKQLKREKTLANAAYERVSLVLEKKNPEASEELRNVEKVKSQLGTEIRMLKEKIERLEAGVREQPAPDATAPTRSGEGGDSAGSKRPRDEEGGDDAGGEAVKKMKG